MSTSHKTTSTRLARHRLRRKVLLGALSALALGLSVAASQNANAVLTGSTFEGNDGNLAVTTAGNTDWANVAGLNTGTDKASGSSDNAFGQGTKEDVSAVTVVNGSIPPNKNDLTRFYESSEQVSNGHIMLYLGWERAVNIGNANLDFEINQSKNAGFTSSTTGPVLLDRTAGDRLVTYDFGGSGTPTLGLLTWLTAPAGNTVSQCFSANSLPCWGKRVDLTAAGEAEGAVNSGPITESIAGGSLGAGLFGEAAIDLTGAGVFGSGVCTAFGSTFLKSRSSSSFTAEIKDFVAPIPINISNCGTIKIHKVTENGDDSFGYSTTNLGANFSLSNGGEKDYSNVNSGSYGVTENLTTAQVAAGWTLKSVSCTSSGSGTSTSVNGASVSITEGLGGTVDCTYTNHINNSPKIATTLSATTTNIGTPIHDSSTLTGATLKAGGTVVYHAYAGANNCTGTDLLNSSKTVTNGVVPDSGNFTPAAAGTYSFQAVYSGDANNNAATSECSTEQLLVKTNPTIGTTLSATSVDVGTAVHDSAKLGGVTGDAGGQVSYTVYTDNACTTGARDAGTVGVTNGAVPDSNPLTFNTAGTFYWQAVYTGDSKNNGATSTCTDETLTVNKLRPSASTAQNVIPNDSFTLKDGFNPTGTVRFNLYAPSDATCGGTPALTETVSVNGNGTFSTSNTAFVAGTQGVWRWQSTYSGDGNNQSVTSACGTEWFDIENG